MEARASSQGLLMQRFLEDESTQSTSSAPRWRLTMFDDGRISLEIQSRSLVQRHHEIGNAQTSRDTASSCTATGRDSFRSGNLTSTETCQ